jgi:hypothetical protein
MSQMTFPQARAIINGLVNANNQTKQELGQRFAYFLSFTPGPRGPDDGIDGLIEDASIKIHFQSKLSHCELGKDEARKYYSDIQFHRVNISIMLAGVGYKQTFRERLFGHNDIDKVKIHLLTLYDLFCETDAYETAIQDLPRLSQLQNVDWVSYR